MQTCTFNVFESSLEGLQVESIKHLPQNSTSSRLSFSVRVQNQAAAPMQLMRLDVNTARLSSLLASQQSKGSSDAEIALPS